MRKRTKSSAELFIYNEIDGSGQYGISDKDVIAALEEAGDVDQIDVHINSGGGDVFAGVAIYEALRRHPAKKMVYIDGLAASAASVIAMAGDERHISKAGFFMIHPASGGVFGQADDMRSMADVLDKITDRIAMVYEARAGIEKARALDLMKAQKGDGTWFDADEAVAAKLATHVLDGEAKALSPQVYTDKLENARKAFSASIKAKTDIPPPPKLEALPPTTPQTEQKQPASPAGFSLSNEKENPMEREALIRERMENCAIAMEQIQNAANDRGDDLTREEVLQIQDKQSEFNELQSQLEAVVAVKNTKNFLNAPQKEKASTTKATPGQYAANTTRDLGGYNPLKGNAKFTNGIAEFAKAVLENTLRGVGDQRLDAIRNAETSFGTGGEGPGGGYAIPDDFRREIYTNAIEQDPLLSRARAIPTSGRSVTLSTRETQPWETGSVTASTTGEGAAITRSTYGMNQVKIELHKTAALVFASEELLEDAPALANEIMTVGSEQINFKLTNQMIRGSGVNEMLGVLNSPALVTVAKETAGGAQTADTVVVENLYNMYAAMPPRNRRNAVWLVAPNAEPQVWKSAFHSPSGADPIGRAPGTMPNSPFGTLFNLPLIPHEVCNELGDLGDIFLLDMSDYAMPMKGGIQTATSMHFAFDQQLEAFRMTIRAGGAPLWKDTIDSRDGTFSRSPFVTLAARA